ncbi:MAG: hypothetical protein HXS48_00675 [Theionarchaea archaeon]|nr:hypothetical protein [Theionarchaea archaeon]
MKREATVQDFSSAMLLYFTMDSVDHLLELVQRDGIRWIISVDYGKELKLTYR